MCVLAAVAAVAGMMALWEAIAALALLIVLWDSQPIIGAALLALGGGLCVVLWRRAYRDRSEERSGLTRDR